MLREYYQEMIDRNIGVITKSEQLRLKEKSTIAIAGCGGMGGLTAELLVRMGVGHIKIADFDKFEVSNINRQFGAYKSTIGKSKVEVISSILLDIYPDLNLEVFPDGVTENNVETFVKDCNLIIDAIDYNAFFSSVILHRAARKNNLCVMCAQAIGFGATLLTFSPNGLSLEEYVGLSNDASNEEIQNFIIPIEKFCPIVPSYTDPEVVEKVIQKEIEIPNIGIAQALGAGMMAGEAILFLLGKIDPVFVPDFLALDLVRRELKNKKQIAS